MMGSTTNPAGMLQPFTLWGVHNNLCFLVEQALAKVQTASLVKVMTLWETLNENLRKQNPLNLPITTDLSMANCTQ